MKPLDIGTLDVLSLEYAPPPHNKLINRSFRWLEDGRMQWAVCNKKGKQVSYWRDINRKGVWHSFNVVMERMVSINAKIIFPHSTEPLANYWSKNNGSAS